MLAERFLIRLTVTRADLIELRRDLRIIRENIDLRSAPPDRYDDALELDSLCRRLSRAIGSLNCAIGDATRRQKVHASRAHALNRDAIPRRPPQ